MELHRLFCSFSTVKPVLSGHSKRTPNIGFHDPLSLNAGQKYCRMLQWEHSAILSIFIKLPFVIIKICVLSIFEWHLQTCFAVCLFFQETQADGSIGSTVVGNKTGDRENGPGNTRQQETHHHQSDPALVTLSGMYHHTSL